MWDESFLWGLVARRALGEAGLDFTLINSGDVRQGALADYGLLYVPGGWASNKLKALGEEGAQGIKRFVEGGGSYVGVCGGAGLATSEGLRLLNIRRRPLDQRVPSLSGRIMAGISPHPVWKRINNKKRGGARPEFHIWWPSQMEPDKNDPSIKILASFEGETEDTFSSDFNVADTPELDKLEQLYRLNLDPGRMRGSPLVMEGVYGSGRVFITLIHFDTPGDFNGRRALKNLWEYMGCGGCGGYSKGRNEKTAGHNKKKADWSADWSAGWPAWSANELVAPVEGLYRFGLRNFLWFPRGWVVQWRRGVRGLEYFTLREMIRELAACAEDIPPEEITALAGELRRFTEKAKTLLMLERLALQEGRTLTFSNASSLTFSNVSSGEMAALRAELFSDSKSHGGAFKALLDKVDALLYRHLKEGDSKGGI